jgi:hypothetical protein
LHGGGPGFDSPRLHHIIRAGAGGGAVRRVNGGRCGGRLAGRAVPGSRERAACGPRLYARVGWMTPGAIGSLSRRAPASNRMQGRTIDGRATTARALRLDRAAYQLKIVRQDTQRSRRCEPAGCVRDWSGGGVMSSDRGQHRTPRTAQRHRDTTQRNQRKHGCTASGRFTKPSAERPRRLVLPAPSCVRERAGVHHRMYGGPGHGPS